MIGQSINRYLDHAVLKPELTRQEAIAAIRLGIEYKVKTVCVRPCDIDLALELCKGTQTGVSCTLAFPHGVVSTEIKAYEAKLYTAQGVDEIDMVANYGHIKSGLWDLVEKDIQMVADITKKSGILLKVILETSMLTIQEIEKSTEVCITAGADYVKTSTGFNGEGATFKAVEAMVRSAKGRIQVKASGGIRNAKQAQLFMDMGCSRLGNNYTSTAVICTGLAEEKNEQGY